MTDERKRPVMMTEEEIVAAKDALGNSYLEAGGEGAYEALRASLQTPPAGVFLTDEEAAIHIKTWPGTLPKGNPVLALWERVQKRLEAAAERHLEKGSDG